MAGLFLPDLDEILPPYPPLSPEGMRQADATVEFLEMLPQSKGREWYGQPMKLLRYQDRFTRELFGRRDPATGLRRYRKCFIFIPKKNGKSTYAAGVTLKLTVADQELGAECYGAAFDKAQAEIVFEVAKAMVEQEPELDQICRVVAHKNTIHFDANRSFYQAIAHDVEGSHGFNIHGLVIDEFHTWSDGELYRTLDHGTITRAQPMTIIITTAGVFSPESPCWKMYQYAKNVRDGIIEDPTFLPVIFETPKDDDGVELFDWDDPRGWGYANPALGVTIPFASLERKAREASFMPTEVEAYRRLHLNQWTEQLKSWLSMRHWKECGKLRMREEELRGKKAWIGLDLGETRDLTALGIVIPLEDGTVATPVRIFCPDETIRERSKRDNVPYELWSRAGFIHKTEGNVTDYAAIRAEIHRLARTFEIVEICPDPWNALQLTNELISDGFNVVKIPQSAPHINFPAKELERLNQTHKLRHGNNPVLTWAASNATVRTDAHGNVKPDKARSKERIDPVTAIVNGMSRALADQVERPKWFTAS